MIKVLYLGSIIEHIATGVINTGAQRMIMNHDKVVACYPLDAKIIKD